MSPLNHVISDSKMQKCNTNQDKTYANTANVKNKRQVNDIHSFTWENGVFGQLLLIPC